MQYITRAVVRANRETLYVFGDNMQRRGLGGQAKAMRGEPNAIGVPVKWAPKRTEDAYFTDDDFAKVHEAIRAAFTDIRAWLDSGRDVVIPAEGLGSGL